MTAIWQFLMELLGFSKQIAENRGQKIPMEEIKIRQKAENKADELEEDGKIDDWLPELKTFNRYLKPLWQLHAKNQVKNLLDGKARIDDIDLVFNPIPRGETKPKSGRWLRIAYTKRGCALEYFIPTNDKV